MEKATIRSTVTGLVTPLTVLAVMNIFQGRTEHTPRMKKTIYTRRNLQCRVGKQKQAKFNTLLKEGQRAFYMQ